MLSISTSSSSLWSLHSRLIHQYCLWVKVLFAMWTHLSRTQQGYRRETTVADHRWRNREFILQKIYSDKYCLTEIRVKLQLSQKLYWTLQVKSCSKTLPSLIFKVVQKQELKLSAHRFAATNKPPNKPLSNLSALCRSCCCLAEKLASWQQTGSSIHMPDESNPWSTRQGVRHRYENNAVSPSRLFVRRGHSVCCQKRQCWLHHN